MMNAVLWQHVSFVTCGLCAMHTDRTSQTTHSFIHSFIYLHSFNPYKVGQPTGYGTSHMSKII